MKYELSDLCSYVMDKVEVAKLNNKNYISTENMLPNKGGVVRATSLPKAVQARKYCAGDILLSNIRPYFKKIWFAREDGGCSNDVLVFRANENTNATFLYYVLSDDAFFEYATVTAKGTKMPRGDKTAIMSYGVPCIEVSGQKKIADILGSMDKKIELNKKINDNLAA